METITIPSLYCPFSSTLNINVERVHEQTLEWVQRYQLFTERGRRHLTAAQFAWLMAYAYPTVPLDELQLATDWNTLLFARDDVLVETGLDHYPDELAQANSYLLAVLQGTVCTAPDDPLAQAMQNIRDRLWARSTPQWMEQFIQSVAGHFAGGVWEAQYYAQGSIPDLATYRQMRPLTGGLYSSFDLIELTEGFLLPSAVRAHPAIQSLALMTSNIVLWANDIFSLEKELQDEEIHNLVIVLQHEYDISLQEALERAAAMHDAEVHAFIAAADDVPTFGASVDAHVRQYIDGMRIWIGANLDWSRQTARYRPGAEVIQPLLAQSFALGDPLNTALY